MRIALLTHQWPGARMGGIGSAVAQTASAMALAGHDVHVFTLALPEDVRASLGGNFTVHEVPDLATRVSEGMVSGELAAAAQSGGDGVYRLSIASLLCERVREVHREERFDVVEAPEVEALGLPLLLDPSFDAPIVTHLHCCTALARKFNGTLVEGDGDLLPALEFAAIHLADAVCAPTRAVVDATRGVCPIDRGVEIIPHPFSASGEFVAPPDEGAILFVGRLERLKGVECLTRALNIFLPKFPEATVRFVGPDTSTAPGGGSMRRWMESELRGDVRGRVTFLGEVSRAQIEEEWRRARFGVMPSVWENFSVALCEGMGAGRTVIVAEGTGSVEVVGEAGVVVERESPAGIAGAIEKLWVDRSLVRRLSERACDRIREFFPGKAAGSRLGFYERVVDAKASASGVGFPTLDPALGEGPNRRTGWKPVPREMRSHRLFTLPPECAAAVLPALVRIASSLCGLHSAMETPGTRLLRLMSEIESESGSPAEVVLYGAGKHTARLLAERNVWESKKHKVVGIIDDHPRFGQTPVYLDLPVQALESATARVAAGKVLPPVVLSTDTYEDQFWEKAAPLREAGVAVFRLYS